jgi:hypothetical protein
MTATHDALLAELYEIDPTLREHESDLVPLLQKLLADDPAKKPDAAFVKKLRKELAARAAAMESGAVEHRVSYAAPSAFSAFFSRFAFAAAGAVAAVVIAVPVTLRYHEDHDVDFPAPTDGRMAEGVPSDDQAGAFAPTVAGTVPTGNPVPGVYGRGQGGGGGDMSMGKMSAVSSLIAPWNPVKYRLEGDLPELPQGEVEVLERDLHPLNVPFGSVQNAFKDAAVDLSSFDGMTVDYVSMTQRRPYGYTINVSMADGSVSINQAWEFWPHPEQDCTDDACYRGLQPTLSDVPADGELIRIADAFLAEHDIDVSAYGDPVVDDAWRRDYERAEDKRYAWIPESMRVVYPLIVDGKTVTEAGGGAAGVSVQVSVKQKRVTDAYGLMAYQFSRADHPAVSDRSDVERFLGMAGSQTPDAPTVTLTDPVLGFVRLYTYDNGANQELFVPALVFRVPATTDAQYYLPQTVAVPLAKDLLDQAQPPIPIDPMPMPRPMDGGGPAVDVPAEEPLMVKPEAR